MVAQENGKIFLNVRQRDVASLLSSQGLVKWALTLRVLEHGQTQGPGTLVVDRLTHQVLFKLSPQVLKPAEEQIFLILKMCIERGAPHIGAVNHILNGDRVKSLFQNERQQRVL